MITKEKKLELIRQHAGDNGSVLDLVNAVIKECFRWRTVEEEEPDIILHEDFQNKYSFIRYKTKKQVLLLVGKRKRKVISAYLYCDKFKTGTISWWIKAHNVSSEYILWQPLPPQPEGK